MGYTVWQQVYLRRQQCRVNQSIPLHQRHVKIFLPCISPFFFSSWSKEHERTATLPLSFSFCLRSFFMQRLWLCVIRRCDTFPVAHRYPLPSQEPWHAARSPARLRGHNRGTPCEDLLSGPARLYNPPLPPAHQQTPSGNRRAEIPWLIPLFILTVCRIGEAVVTWLCLSHHYVLIVS